MPRADGSPLASASGSGNSYTLRLRKGDTVDRFQLQEDIVVGQRVRNYTITSESSPSSSDGGVGGAASTVLVSGDAIGTKRIHLLPAPITVQQDTTIRLLVTHAVATPQIKSFVRSAHHCHSRVFLCGKRVLRLVGADDDSRAQGAFKPCPKG